VGRLLIQAVSFVLRILMLLVLAAGIGLSALGWRLAQGPMPIPSIEAVNDALTARFSVLGPGLSLRFGQAWVNWDGWRDGTPQPIHLRMDGLRAIDGAGIERASLGSVEVALAVPPLLRGVVAPERVVVVEPVATLRRDEAGRLSIDLGVSTPAVREGDSPPVPDRDAALATETIERLLRPAPPDSPLALLREVRMERGLVQVRDEPLQLDWAIQRAELLGTRGEDGAVTLSGSGTLRLPGHEIPVRIAGRAGGEPLVAEASLEIDSVSPPALANALSSLRPLTMLDSTLSARFTARYAFDGGDYRARAELRASAGRIMVGDSNTAFQGATAVLTGDGRRLELEALELVLPPGAAGRPPTRITAKAQANREAALWKGRMELGLDTLAVADLALYWPPGVAEGARSWIVENATAGRVRDGRWVFEGEAAPDFSGGRLTGLTGRLRAEGLTVHWLRPIPPAEGIEGTIDFSLREITVLARGARQSGTRITVPEARIRILDLGVPAPDAEKLDIEARVAGPLQDVLNLIRHPRLKLFKDKPLDVGPAAGGVEARVSVGLPLVADLPDEALRVSAQGRVTNGRVERLVGNYTVDRAMLDVSVDVAGLRARGTAALEGIPGRVEAELDFRQGPQSQVTERVRAEGRADAAALARLGVEAAPWVRGPLGYTALVERRRSGETRISARGDLRDARIAIAPFAYAKPAGVPARGEGVVVLRGEDLAAIEGVRVEGPNLFLRGRVGFGRESAAWTADMVEARIGGSVLSGRLATPAAAGGAWDVRARGTMLDARGILKELGLDGEGEEGGGGSVAIRADVAFDRVLLREGRELAPVTLRMHSDAQGVLRDLRAVGRGHRGGGFEAVVVPSGAGRAMEARVDGLGTLLRDLGLFDAVDGGAFHASGTWADNAPGTPLVGVADMRDFGVREAQSIGKILQALSLYGIPEAVRGPGIRFTLANASYSLSPAALTLWDARAVSASLGLTVEGRVLRQADRYDLRGTVVPSYAVNSALGRLPGIGRLFTSERNGGLFAANFRMGGKLDDPEIRLDPLSILAPGALRGMLAPNGAGR